MKYDIVIQTLVGTDSEHVFIAEHGVNEPKVRDLYLRHVQEQFDRLERGKPDAYLADFSYGAYASFMSRGFAGVVTSVNVFATPSDKVRDIWEAQERVRKGESQA